MKLATRTSQLATRPAFTLVELMLSLFMVLILILGINYVFRSATEAVGAGQVTNQINADAQASQPIVFDDLRNASKNPPAFIISSQLVTQFLNADDAKTSSDPTVIVIDNAGNKATISDTPPGNVSPALPSNRVHRADLLKFFAHAFYQRRSGPDGSYYANDTSNDAFIEIGHAALPANDLSAFYGPSSLPNNASGLVNGTTVPGVPRIGAYAADWVLARRITLLKDANSSGIAAGDFYYPIAGAAPNGVNATAFGCNMSPLSYGSVDSNGAGVTQFQSSRYDMAGVTPEQFDRIIENAILGWQNQPGTNYAGPSLWWNPLVYALPMNQAVATLPQYYTLTNGAPNPNAASVPYVIPFISAAPGYTGIPIGPAFATDPGLWYNRPQCNPTIQNPVTSASIAEMAPYFLQHCSQFIVEYAGDYLQQDNNPASGTYGNMVGLGSDGQIDYYVDVNGNKHTRWYGMPRSSTGATHDDGLGNQVLIRGFDSATDGPTATVKSYTGPGAMSVMLNYFTDVIPLRDYYSYWFGATGGGTTGAYAPPWEVDINFNPAHDYGAVYTAPAAGAAGVTFNDPNNPPRYVAAWHDDMPAMVRILIKVDDPNNKVKDGPWYEYVFRLK